METYASVEETIKQNIEYEVLMKNDRNDHELIQGICKLIVETMLYTGKRIVIASNEYPAEVVKQRFRKLNYMHIQYIRNGELSMKSINRLMDALEELKQDKRYEMLKIELTTEELDVLVNRIYEYTVKLASDNAVELTDDEKKSSDNSILNLQRYLKTQKRIFKSVA